jgi:hypothetical protein
MTSPRLDPSETGSPRRRDRRLHDDRPELAPTAEAVDAVLEGLRRRTWAAVTVSEPAA